ncbi:tetratricopeptide repeat protein, partial [Halalkalibacter flavus]|uniref:tetratricopeptide repeat protein n=1 Tax=Halalkalibacter flavus TaxID=3090668 RepID=UPI003D6748A3
MLFLAGWSAAVAQPENLGNIRRLASQGRTAVAIQRIESFLERNPGNAEARLLQGVFLAENGDRAGAQKVFDRLLNDH